MAAIAVDREFDLAAFREYLIGRLPEYARPVFLRILSRIAVTGTFKHRKSELAREGYDPRTTRDALYFSDAARGAFVPIDLTLYERMQTGRLGAQPVEAADTDIFEGTGVHVH